MSDEVAPMEEDLVVKSEAQDFDCADKTTCSSKRKKRQRCSGCKRFLLREKPVSVKRTNIYSEFVKNYSKELKAKGEVIGHGKLFALVGEAWKQHKTKSN